MKKNVIVAMSLIIAFGMMACGGKEIEKQEVVEGTEVSATEDNDANESSAAEQPAEENSEAEETTSAEDNVADETASTENSETEEAASTETTATIDETSEADAHFLAYLEGKETDVNGETFWAVEEPDIEYALYDMNDDGVNELIVRAYGSWIYDINIYKDGKIQSAGVENLGSSGVTFINDKNQFVSGDTGHEGRAMYVVSKINPEGKSEMVMALVNYFDEWAASGSPEFYKKENPSTDYLENIDKFDTISEEEFNTLVDEYTNENTSIEWIKA